MHMRTWLVNVLALIPLLGLTAAAPAPNARPAQTDDRSALNGDWLYVEDRTEGRAEEDQGPPMSVKFGLRVEEDAVVMLRSGGREERVPFDGPDHEEVGESSVTMRRGAWKDGAFEYDTEIVRTSDGSLVTLIRREFRATPDGLLVRVSLDPPTGKVTLALYRHPQDVALPEPAEAVIDDMEWLMGAWVGAGGTSSTEERWSPPRGGAMLGVSRTVKNGRMSAFEYLRIVERDGGLVYVAQPGGRPPTEFVLTELDGTLAVFENPRHDFPQRIVYELSDSGDLTASIGFARGGRPQRFEFTPEGE